MCANGVLCKMAVLLLVPRLGTAAAAAVGTGCIGVSLLFRACCMHPLGTVALLQHATLLATVSDPQRKMFCSMSMTCKVPFTCPSLCCDLICCWYYYNCMITLNYLSVQGCGACVPCEVCAIQHGSTGINTCICIYSCCEVFRARAWCAGTAPLFNEKASQILI